MHNSYMYECPFGSKNIYWAIPDNKKNREQFEDISEAAPGVLCPVLGSSV